MGDKSLKSFIFFLSFLCGDVLGASFMPENNLFLQDNKAKIANVDEQTFNEVINEVEQFYKPLIKDLYGADLQIARNWEDPEVNAYAERDGNTWIVQMFGGLARRPEITRDGFQMVVCHEVGHHLGGFPFVNRWAANDGQSDYFATQSCAKEIWGSQVKENQKAEK